MDNKQVPRGWKALSKARTINLSEEHGQVGADFRATFHPTGPSAKVLEALVEQFWHRSIMDFESARPEVTMAYLEGQRSVIQFIMESLD